MSIVGGHGKYQRVLFGVLALGLDVACGRIGYAERQRDLSLSDDSLSDDASVQLSVQGDSDPRIRNGNLTSPDAALEPVSMNGGNPAGPDAALEPDSMNGDNPTGPDADIEPRSMRDGGASPEPDSAVAPADSCSDCDASTNSDQQCNTADDCTSGVCGADGTCQEPTCSGANEYLDTNSGSCYLLQDTTLTYADALQACQTWGGSLASITSQAEQDFIGTFRGDSDCWIGLDDITTEGTFVWTNGDPVTYTNWSSDEPNNDGNEDCGEMLGNWIKIPGYAGTWNDKECSEVQCAYCER